MGNNYTAESGIVTVPAGKEEQDYDLLQKMLQWLQDSENSTSETRYRQEELEDFEFYAGDQDTAEVLEALGNRPNTVYNEIKPKVDMLVGLAAQNREAPVLEPVGAEDEPLVEAQNELFKFHRRREKLPRKEMECFEHAVKGGRSFLHFYPGGDNPYQPEIKAKMVPGRDCHLDPDGREYDLSDHRYFFSDKWMGEDDIKAVWPDFAKEEVSVNMLSQESTSKLQFFDEARNKFRVVECWYRDYEPYYWFINPVTQKPDSLNELGWSRFQKALKNGTIPLPQGGNIPPSDVELPAIKKMRRVVKYAHFSGGVLLDSGISPYTHLLIREQFPYILCGAYKSEVDNRWFSVINMMKDPQRGLNTTRRQLVHLLQTSPKGILVHEVGAILNEDEYDEKSAQPNFRLVINQGKMDKWQFSNQPQISPIYGQLDSLFIQCLKDISGIQDSLMGIQTSSREPGITLSKRIETGIAVLYILFGNFRDFRINAATFQLGLQQQYDTMEMILRVEGPNGQNLLAINSQLNPQVEGFNDTSSGVFDIIVNEDVETFSMRGFILEMLVQFSQNNPGIIPADLIMEYSRLPFSAKQRVREYQQLMMQREDEKFKMELEAKNQKK